MSKAIRVKISGKEYVLRGDDEQAVLSAAREVDNQFREIQEKQNEHSTNTLSILAALNLAERLHKSERQAETDAEYISQQIEKMVQFLAQNPEQQGTMQSR